MRFAQWHMLCSELFRRLNGVRSMIEFHMQAVATESNREALDANWAVVNCLCDVFKG